MFWGERGRERERDVGEEIDIGREREREKKSGRRMGEERETETERFVSCNSCCRQISLH